MASNAATVRRWISVLFGFMFLSPNNQARQPAHAGAPSTSGGGRSAAAPGSVEPTIQFESSNIFCVAPALRAPNIRVTFAPHMNGRCQVMAITKANTLYYRSSTTTSGRQVARNPRRVYRTSGTGTEALAGRRPPALVSGLDSVGLRIRGRTWIYPQSLSSQSSLFPLFSKTLRTVPNSYLTANVRSSVV
jgi:hypothetical protein